MVLLARERRRVHVDLTLTVRVDGARRGAVVSAPRRGVVRRAEPAAAGPLVLEARSVADGTVCEVWGPRQTPCDDVDRELRSAVAWAGLQDTPAELEPVVAGHPMLRRLLRLRGEMRLSRVPRVGEALGRSVLGQLVQVTEARRSAAQLAVLCGTPAPGRLWAWPTAGQLGAVPVHALRRCGISVRGARALHAACLSDGRLSESRGRWSLLDTRLRTLPGVGAWTSGETRLALGDPDAVSVGDYHLPSVVGSVLGGAGARHTTRGDWDDAQMLALLEPFTGQRGRVIRLCEWAVHRGLVPGPARRGPRQPLSAHRYW